MIHRRLLRLAGAIPGAIVALAAFGVGISMLHVGFALVLGTLLASLVRGGGDPAPWLVALVALSLVRGGAIWVREVVTTRVGATVRVRLRRRLLARLAGVSASERDAGRTATLVIDGVDGLDQYYTRYLPQLLVVLLVPAMTVAAVWAVSPAAGIALTLTVAVAVLAPRAWDARLLRNGRTRWARFARLSSAYVEALQAIPLLRAFGATDRVAARLGREADDLRDTTMAQLRLSLIETGLSAAAMHLGTVLAVLAAIVSLVDGSLGASTVVVLLLARECFRPLQELGAAWHAGYLGLTAVDDLDRLLSARPMASGSRALPAEQGPVELADVSYRYDGTEVGVSDVTLRIAQGETVAIIGPSGSGKSTLARLLERDRDPDAGAVRVGGVDLRELSATARAHSVVVVPQDPVLFAWTVRDNLRLHRQDARDHDIEHAARMACVHDVVSALPDGYDTVLAEDGEQLSGGQRQRLALARALLSPAPVLVLDEVTSALDVDTERRLVDALAIATVGRTVVVIAHRESACRNAGRWIGMRGGRIVASGDGAPESASLDVLEAR